MTNQEAFTKVRDHLLTQMERSMEDGRCLYRGPNDLKCAVGCLIPDEEYRPDLNAYPVYGTLVSRLPCLFGLDFELLNHLQIIHDSDKIDNWEASLREIAITFGLNWE